MGSSLNAKIRVFDTYTADFIIHHENGSFIHEKVVSLLSGDEKQIDLHLASNSNNFASINVNIMKPSAMSTSDTNDGLMVAKYFTVTCVADWMWFLLTLEHEFSEYLQIIEARPDPRKLVGYEINL